METTTESNKLLPLIGMTLSDLEVLAAEFTLPRFRAKQIAKWLYDKRVTLIDEMTDIPKGVREAMSKRYCVGRELPSLTTESIDGTKKYLFSCHDGNAVESVYIPEEDRATLCISSQKGCKMNCSFCMTGRQGFHGNLTAAQIVNQVLSIPESLALTNVVFMGMGEPLDNFEQVMKVIEIMTSPWGFAWSPKRVTVSSIGRLRELKRLAEETSVHIAISVHSPFHDERQQLMPVEKAFSVKDVMSLLRNYDFAHQRRLSVEYIMWNGVNDDIRHAEALEKLIRGTSARVNLIRFHAIPGSPLRTCAPEKMTAFRDALNDMGVLCTIRRSRGEDIMAACGMLAGKNKKSK